MMHGYCEKCGKILKQNEFDSFGYANEFKPPLSFVIYDVRNNKNYEARTYNQHVQLCWNCRGEITKMLCNYFQFNMKEPNRKSKEKNA